jgi:hypothetical protein
MITVGPKDSFSGQINPGYQLPYFIMRPKVLRVSSTVMQNQTDGTLYYVDVQIESQGAGDSLNLPENTRMVVTSGVSTDGYTYTVQNNTLTFSPYEEVSLNFDRRFLPIGNSDSPENLTEISGRNLKITYESSTVVQLVNDLMRSDLDRPIVANPIARHFLPSYVYSQFIYKGGMAPADVGQEIEDYINSLGAMDELSVSELEAFLTRRGATYVQHPLQLVSITHDIDRNLVVNRSLDKIGGTNAVPYSGTGRIACFFAQLGEGLTVTKE